MSDLFIRNFIQVNNADERDKALLIFNFLDLKIDTRLQNYYTFPYSLYRFNGLVSFTDLLGDALVKHSLIQIPLEDFLNY